MSSTIEQFQKIEEQKKTLVDGLVAEIMERIELLNNAGLPYRLVQGPEQRESHPGGKGKKRLTSEQTFLSKAKAASFRKWRNISAAKKQELWKKQEPSARLFYRKNYRDGVKISVQKFRTSPIH